MNILIEEKRSLDKNLKRKFHIKATTNKTYFRNMERLKSASTFSVHLAMKYKSVWFSVFLNYVRGTGIGGIRRLEDDPCAIWRCHAEFR